MKILNLFISVLTICTSCKSQTNSIATSNETELNNSILDQIEIQGVDTKQKLLYGYFFFDKDKRDLELLKNELIKQSYKFVGLDKADKEEYMLNVEKVEVHSRQSLSDREQYLRQLAIKFNISSYDGFDVGNAYPKKPLVSNESFELFMKSKNGSELFDLGIKLYDLEIDDKAEIVFKGCIKNNINTDTSYFKLGNTLLRQKKIGEGIQKLEQAIKLNPNYLSAFYNLGAICYDNNLFQKSIQYYQKADKLAPNDDDIVYGIAASQFALKQYDKSLENCKKALQLNKKNENAIQLLKMLKSKTN